MHKLALVPALIALAIGCTPQDDGACTAIAVYSVTVDVQDADGNPIGDADVVYTVDGGAEQDCEAAEEGTWLCGVEVRGEIEVFAIADEGEADMAFDVEADRCHVIPQSGTLVLE